MSVLPCVNKKTWTLHHAAHEKQAGCFSRAEKQNGHLDFVKFLLDLFHPSYLITSLEIAIWFPLFCESLLCYGGWRGCCALSFSLLASRMWFTAGPVMGPVSSPHLLNRTWRSFLKSMLVEPSKVFCHICQGTCLGILNTKGNIWILNISLLIIII